MSDHVLEHRPGRGASPYDVWEFACGLLRDGWAASWADMFAEDGVLEIPLGRPLLPPRLVGREEIRVLAPVQKRAYEMHPATRTNLVVHETTDPEVIVCEFVSERQEKSTGNVYKMPYVHVVRVRNGEIVHLRDYAPIHLAPPSVDQVVAALGARTEAAD